VGAKDNGTSGQESRAGRGQGSAVRSGTRVGKGRGTKRVRG
jgi:hypothetical protein